jgi:hypothetical protein
VAWRKGTDIDQELWPIEVFGGVSDEQFWDDLAADKPLATTARTAQADSGPSTQQARAYPATRSPAADRTAVQLAVRSVQPAARPSPTATRTYPARTQSSTTATQAVRAAYERTESRGRRSATVGGPGSYEDPLTSPAYSLRPKGAVGGRSCRSSNGSRELTRETAYQPGSGSVGRHAIAAAYPFPWQSHSRPIQSTSTPSYGDMYGYRNPVSPANPGRANGNWGYGGPSGNAVGVGHWSSYPVHPPVDGYRGPYDPWGVRARLTRLR